MILRIKQGDTFSRTITVYSKTNIVNRGVYKGAYTYNAEDFVEYLGSLYFSIAGGNKGNLPTNATYWTILPVQDISSDTLSGGISHVARDNPFIAFTTAFTTDGTDGKFTIALTATQTAALDFDNAFFDVQKLSGATVLTLLSGRIMFDKEYDV